MTFAEAVAITQPPARVHAARSRRYVQAALRLAGRSDECARMFKTSGDLKWCVRASRQTWAALRLLRWANTHSRSPNNE